MPPVNKIEKAKKLVEHLIKMSDDEGLKLRAMQILDRMILPMDKVLEKVPGRTVVEKSAAIGISRQSFYSWKRGTSRPNTRQSKRLAELTGLDWQDINGRTRLSPSRPFPPTPGPAGSV